MSQLPTNSVDSVDKFITAVCDQIRAKKTHGFLSAELTAHIEDQKAAYIKDGMDEDTALEKAVEQMGDPVTVGQELDRMHRPKPDWVLFALTAVLVIIGAAIQYFLSSIDYHSSDMFARYLFHALFGTAALVVIYFADYTILGKYPKVIFIALLVIGSVLGLNANIRISGWSWYSYKYYLSLLCFPSFAGIVYSQRRKGYKGLVVCASFYAIAVIISMCFGVAKISGLIYLTIAYLLLLTAAVLKDWFDVKKSVALTLVYAPIVLLSSLVLLTNHAFRNRLINAVAGNPLEEGYINNLIRQILSGAKLFGESTFIANNCTNPDRAFEWYLPAWNTDYMLTYLIGKVGYAAGIVVVLFISLLIFRMFTMTLRQKNALGFIVSFSVTLAIAAQTLFYIAGNLGFSFSSISLPILSFGGTGFIVNMILIGLGLSVFRNDDLVKDKPQTTAIKGAKNPVIYFQEGKIIIDLSYIYNKLTIFTVIDILRK